MLACLNASNPVHLILKQKESALGNGVTLPDTELCLADAGERYIRIILAISTLFSHFHTFTPFKCVASLGTSILPRVASSFDDQPIDGAWISFDFLYNNRSTVRFIFEIPFSDVSSIFTLAHVRRLVIDADRDNARYAI